MKQMKKLFACTLVLAMLESLNVAAQSLVFHLPDGSMSTVELPSTFTFTPSGEKLIISSGDTQVELSKDRILAVTYRSAKGDVNDDMQVDVADIATIIDIMAGKDEMKSYTTCPDDRHPHLIDLGLPSGTKWACCNVGAEKPEDYGEYYSWGETQTKEVYSWDTYQYGSSWENVVNIGSDIAGTSYDAATANWGAPWRMPTYSQCFELIRNCSSIWTTQNDVYGRRFTGSNGGTIFIPAAGHLGDSDIYQAGVYGYPWSSTLYESHTGSAYDLFFGSKGVSTDYGRRHNGLSVRPVCKN